MSIDSGGKLSGGGTETATINNEELLDKKIKDEKKIDEELEDGELDSDSEDESAQKQQSTKDCKVQQTKSSTNSSTKQSAIKLDDKLTNNSKFNQSNSNSTKQQSSRKRRRRSGSEDSEASLDGKRRRGSNSNNRSSNKSRNSRRNNASTDENSDSEDEDMPKIDQKMMFNMLKQMQEFFIKSDKSNSRQEYDKFFERVKNNKSGHKEMMKFFRKNEKMMNSSHEMGNLPAMFNSNFNSNLFAQNGLPAGNMFTGLQQNLGQQYSPQQMNPALLPPGPNFGGSNVPSFNQPGPNFGGSPFNPPGLLPNPMQQFANAAQNLNELNRNSLASQSSLNSTSSHTNNKKQKKRKKQKEEKEELVMNQEEIPNNKLCKYFLEGHCQKGNGCDFIHQQPYNYKREVCRFYIQDSCGKGDNCTFLHKEFPCKLYHTGQDCTFGENCKFSHEPINEELKEIFINYLDNAELNEELNQAYGLSKNLQTKPPILGNIPEEVKNSYATWVWQKEMKKLELAYTGTKRNLFCIDNEFVLKEEPFRDGYDEDDEYASFNKDIDERQANFFIDKHGDLEIEQDDEINEFTKDNDMRKEFNMFKNEKNATSNNLQSSELKSLDDVKKQWLNDESEDEEEDELNNKELKKEEEELTKKTSIDISKMIDAIRQTTTSSNQSTTNQTSSSNNNSEFWKNILNGVNLNDSNNKSNDFDERSQSSSLNSSSSIDQRPRDPRLLKQRGNKQHTPSNQQLSTTLNSSLVFKIPPEVPFEWSNGEISFKLYQIDVDKIDYSSYKHAYELDNRLKNDPRLQSYFTNSTDLIQQSNSSSSSLNTNIISPKDVLPPLTLSKKNESIPNNLIIPPAPSSKLTALDLISSPSNTTSKQQTFAEQILASVHLPKKDSLIPEKSLSSLADLVTEKSKKIYSDTSNV